MTDWLDWSTDLQASLGVYGLCISIILLSYLSEDLAIISAALLAVDNTLPPTLALLAIFIGIASGDIALYGVGKLGSNWRGLRYRLLTTQGMKQVRSRLKRKPMRNIAIIRFIPGLRTIGFTLSGLFQINFYQFMASVLLATAAWTAVIFFCVYQLGSISWLQDSPLKWLIAPAALVTLWLVNRTSSKRTLLTSNRGASL